MSKLYGEPQMTRGNVIAFAASALLAVAIADDPYAREQKRAAQPQSLSANDLLNASGMQAASAIQSTLNDATPVALSAAWGNLGSSARSFSASDVAQGDCREDGDAS
jgi:hypothetical protein